MNGDGLDTNGKPLPGFAWGKPKDYCYLYKSMGLDESRRRLLSWLEVNRYPQMEALRKELAKK